LKKHLSIIVVAFLVGVIICGSVSAADLTVNKTAVKTGPDTATVTIVVNGSSSTTSASADVVFAIDSSGSMGWNDPSNLRLIAANNFIDKMNASRDQVGAVDWDSSVQGTQPLTSDFALVKTFINAIDASGGTNLDAGLNASNILLDTGGRSGAAHVIIFLTDGQGTYTPSGSPGSEVDYAVSKGYVIYSVGLGSGIVTTDLEEMANVTGGQYFFAADASALDPIFSAIFQQMTTTATNIVVSDTIPNYVELVGDPSVAPNSRVTNADGSTTFTWNVGTLSTSESWIVNYNLRSSKFGENLPTNLGATVSFTDPTGVQQTSNLPIPRVNFEDPNDPGDDTKVNAATIEMQKTGVPLLGMVLAFLMVMGGFLVSKK
jgi:Ca-activated chloride channel family protein